MTSIWHPCLIVLSLILSQVARSIFSFASCLICSSAVTLRSTGCSMTGVTSGLFFSGAVVEVGVVVDAGGREVELFSPGVAILLLVEEVVAVVLVSGKLLQPANKNALMTKI